MTLDDAPDLLTLRETAKLLRCNVSHVKRHKDELGGRTVGRLLRFSRAAILARYGPPACAPNPTLIPAEYARTDLPDWYVQAVRERQINPATNRPYGEAI